MSKFFKELKRRNVLKETIAYLVVAWLILQILAVVLPIWKAPGWILQIVTITLALGLPLWILFSWNYQITTTGIKKTIDTKVDQSHGSKINSGLNLIIMIAIVAAIAIIWMKPSMVSSKPIDNPALVILPFENTDNNPENDWLAYSLAKNIRDQLSRFDALNVLDFKASEDLLKSESSYEDIADELDASYILKGRIENKNGKLTIETELIDS
ncbi:MAG: hypothetical protein HKN54_02725, partial [Flavobacteriaceae bacterium]|nr:hypothetical protein [Flavobacteriaceae bacterium]